MSDKIRIRFTIDKEHKEFIQFYAKVKGFRSINALACRALYAYLTRYPILRHIHLDREEIKLSRADKRILKKVDIGNNQILSEFSLMKLSAGPEEQ